MAVALFLSPLISLLVQKVTGSLIEQFCRIHGMEDDRKKLQCYLLAIQEKIVHVEKHEANSPLVRTWLKQLRAVANEASHVLDEFPNQALRQQSSASNKVKSLLSVVNPVLFRLRISKKLKNTLDKIDGIIAEMSKFNFELCKPVCTVDRPLTCSIVNEAEVIGRDSDKEEIVNALLDLQCQRGDIPVSVLPIIGEGGLGKTTLVQLVYNDKRVKECFDLLLWVCVSQGFNVVNIIKSIIEVTTNGEVISTSNIELLHHRLCRILAEKKYLLVLDDVFIKDLETWDSLKELLFSGNYSGSVVIVTTCSKRVAYMVETIPTYHLTPLNEGYSWDLFQRRAFREGVEDLPELVEIGRNIVRNCCGSPRALKAVGTLLNSKRERGEWHAIAESIWDDEVSATEISLEISAAEEFNSSLRLKLLQHQTFKQVSLKKHKCSNNSKMVNFILNNSIYKWQRCNGFDRSEPHLSSSIHPDLDILLTRLSSSDPEAQHLAAGAIRSFTRTKKHRLVMAQAGCVPLLKNLLSSPDSHIQEHAITALLNLSICHENKAKMVASGLIDLIVHTVKTGNTEARENAAATLFNLSVIDEYKALIGAARAIPALVSLMNEGRPQGRMDAITALLNLCLYHGNKGKAVRAGLIPLLMCLLTDQAELLTNDAVVLMAILASHSEGRLAIWVAEAIPALVEIVKSGSPRNRENAAALLLMLCRGKGGEMFIHQAAECGLVGPIMDLVETGTLNGKRQALLLEDLIVRYSCSKLEPHLVNEAGQKTDEEMALMTTIAHYPERTLSTGTTEAEPAVLLIVKSGCPRNGENVVALSLSIVNREGKKIHITDLPENHSHEDRMLRYFFCSLKLVD